MPRTYNSYSVEHRRSGCELFVLACVSLQSMVIGGSGVTDILMSVAENEVCNAIESYPCRRGVYAIVSLAMPAPMRRRGVSE